MFNNSLNFSDDDDVFDPTSASNLANIFEENMQTPPEDANSSLKYIPKKPKKPAIADDIALPKNSFVETATKSSTETTNKSEWTILLAKVVTAFQLINNVHKSHGKIGLAILKNNENNMKLILYRTKDSILSTINLSKSKKVFENNVYLQYHDDVNAFWSIHFTNNDKSEVMALIKDSCLVQNNDEVTGVKNEKVIKFSDANEYKKIDEEEITNKINEPYDKIDDNQTKKTKDSILTRMAKMGQAVPFFKTHLLPDKPTNSEINKTQSISSDTSESSDDDSISKTDKISIKQLIIGKKNQKHQQLVPVIHTSHNQSQQFNQAHQQQQPTIDPILNIYFSEQRQQNTEVRFNISKLDTKLDKIIDKIDLIKFSNMSEKKTINSSFLIDDEVIMLEEQVIDLKKENLRLRLENNGFDEMLQSMKTDSVSIVSNTETGSTYAESKIVIDEKINYELKIQNLLQKIDEQNIEKIKLGKTVVELTDEKNKIMRENLTKDDLIKNSEDKINGLLEIVEKNKSSINEINKSYNDDVKNLMNDIYQSIYNKLSDDNVPDASIKKERKEILTFLGVIFKEKTHLALRPKSSA